MRHIVGGIVWSSIFGWWQFPFGIVAAPWQILNGLKQLIRLPDESHPSPLLEREVKLRLAQQVRDATF